MSFFPSDTGGFYSSARHCYLIFLPWDAPSYYPFLYLYYLVSYLPFFRKIQSMIIHLFYKYFRNL